MAVSLSEDWAGCDTAIHIPNLQSCVGVVATIGGSAELLGMHLTVGTKRTEVAVILAQWKTWLGNRTVGQIHLLGDLEKWAANNIAGAHTLVTLMETLRRELRGNGAISTFDLINAEGGGPDSMVEARGHNPGIPEIDYHSPGAYTMRSMKKNDYAGQKVKWLRVRTEGPTLIDPPYGQFAVPGSSPHRVPPRRLTPLPRG